MKRAGRWIALLGTLIFFSLTPPRTANMQADTPSWCVSVWYPSSDAPGGLDSIAQNADLIATVNPFWYTPQADGTLRAADKDAENADLLADWRADGLKIIPSIFAGIPTPILDPTVRAFHIQQLVALVERMKYDGIDIDYEGFSLSSRDAFSAFVEELSAALHAQGKRLTIAVHAKTDDAGTWEGATAQDWSRIALAADVFEIMTYDYTNRNQPPGPISPPAWVHDVLAYAATITDLRKVRMGLPFYGYTWQRDNPPATTTNWVAVQRLIATFKPEILRDPAVMEAHVEYKGRGLPKQTIYFADSVGIQYKVQTILNNFPNLGGVAIWGIGGEDPADWDVLRAAHQANCRP